MLHATFAYLNLVLEEFANKMALRTGGLSNKLIDSNALGTIELSTGLQISGFSARLLSMKANQFTYKQLEKQRWLTEKRISRTWNFDTQEGLKSDRKTRRNQSCY
jgi:hypothetical protein